MTERDKQWSGVIGPHGGYRNLKSYQNAEIVHDATVAFCNRFIDRRSRTHDQMVQAARSGKQNIAEGSMASGTSRKTELKLVSVARASLEELLPDYQDFIRQNGLALWEKNHPKAQAMRKLAYTTNRSYVTYRPYIEGPAEIAANALICLIHQANYLLDQQLRQLDRQFREEGGFTEKLRRARTQARKFHPPGLTDSFQFPAILVDGQTGSSVQQRNGNCEEKLGSKNNFKGDFPSFENGRS